MSQRQALDGLAVGLMVLITLIWGLQQVFVKAVAEDMSPILQIALRSGIAGGLLALVMLVRREALMSRETLLPGLVAGVLFALEFFFVGEGLKHTTASHMIVFLYSAPVFVALSLHFSVEGEQLSSIQWFGIMTAFSGIALTFLWRADTGGEQASDMLWGDLLALLAALSWGATTVLIRRTSLSNAPAMQTLFYQLSLCFIILLTTAALTSQTSFNATTPVLANLAFQGLVVSFGSLFAWFWMLRRYPASQLGVFTFLTPIFGIVFGVWLLGEPLEPSFIAGAVLVMSGIMLVNSHEKIAQRLRMLRD